MLAASRTHACTHDGLTCAAYRVHRVQVTRPGLVENEDRVLRDIRAETLARWNDTVLSTRKFLMDNVVEQARDGDEGAGKR